MREQTAFPRRNHGQTNLPDGLEQMAGGCAGKSWLRTSAFSRGPDGTYHTFDRPRDLVRRKKRAVHTQPHDSGTQKLRNLWGCVKYAGRIDARTALQVSAHGKLLPSTVAQAKVSVTQRTARAVMDAAIGDLQHAVLAGHRANATEHHESERQRRSSRQSHDLSER